MTQRLFIVGTDTEVGKTAVTAALLRTAAERDDLTVIPFKPAQSGDQRPTDAERLLRAARLPLTSLADACPMRFGPPLAPGLAEDRTAFLPGTRADASHPSNDHPAIPAVVRSALEAWEHEHRPTLTLIEGAGGLHVPMPGGTWQPAWIEALAPTTLVVGRAGLGTINHTTATIEGLRTIGRPPLGFVLSQTVTIDDPSIPDNAAVIEHHTGVPHLGTLTHGPEPTLVPEMLDAILARLPA